MPNEAEPESDKLDSEGVPDEVSVKIGPVTGKFFNIPKVLKQLLESGRVEAAIAAKIAAKTKRGRDTSPE